MRAGEDAAGNAVGDRDAKLVIAFGAISYDLEALLGGINDRCGGAPPAEADALSDMLAEGARLIPD